MIKENAIEAFGALADKIKKEGYHKNQADKSKIIKLLDDAEKSGIEVIFDGADRGFVPGEFKEGFKAFLSYANDEKVAYKMLNIMDTYWEECVESSFGEELVDDGYSVGKYEKISGYDFVQTACKKILRANSGNEKIAEKSFELSSKFTKLRNGLLGNSLWLYVAIAETNPQNRSVLTKITDEIKSSDISSSGLRYRHSEAEIAKILFDEIISNNHDEKLLTEKVLESISTVLKKNIDRDKFQPWKGLYTDIALKNMNNSNVVEKSISVAEHLGTEYSSSMWAALSLAGYAENGFLEKYIAKLNNHELSPEMNFEVVKGFSDKLNTDVIEEIANKAMRYIDSKESDARKWHREPFVSAEEYKNLSIVGKVIDARHYQEAVAKAKAMANPPATILIPEMVNDTYGDYANRVYIKDEKGDYLATSVVDELHFGNEESAATDQLKANDKLFATSEGVYIRQSSDEDFKLLENNSKSTYRVLNKNNYWRDVKTGDDEFYHQGAEEGSVLVSKNPVTGKFEDIEFEVDRSHGNFLQATSQNKQGEWITTIYKRSETDGKFYADADFPGGECISSFHDDKKFSITFWVNKNYYTYVSPNSNEEAQLSVRDGMTGETNIVERFSEERIKYHKPHVQLPLENLKELISEKQNVLRQKMHKGNDSEKTESPAKKTYINTNSKEKDGR